MQDPEGVKSFSSLPFGASHLGQATSASTTTGSNVMAIAGKVINYPDSVQLELSRSMTRKDATSAQHVTCQ